ncbi:MAG: hypothetical protein ABI620_08025, partial [Chloroflexota bacterium]
MTDDATRRIETPMEPAAPAADAPMEPAAPPPPAAEPALGAPVSTTAPVVATASGGGRGRWVAAGLVAALAVVVTIGAILLFGQQSTPGALQYIPADAAVVAELRLDLPGDQMQHLGNL